MILDLAEMDTYEQIFFSVSLEEAEEWMNVKKKMERKNTNFPPHNNNRNMIPENTSVICKLFQDNNGFEVV